MQNYLLHGFIFIGKQELAFQLYASLHANMKMSGAYENGSNQSCEWCYKWYAMHYTTEDVVLPQFALLVAERLQIVRTVATVDLCEEKKESHFPFFKR